MFINFEIYTRRRLDFLFYVKFSIFKYKNCLWILMEKNNNFQQNFHITRKFQTSIYKYKKKNKKLLTVFYVIEWCQI